MLLMTLGMMRIIPMSGVAGLDIAAIIEVAKTMDYDSKSVVDILSDAEATIVEKINNR